MNVFDKESKSEKIWGRSGGGKAVGVGGVEGGK